MWRSNTGLFDQEEDILCCLPSFNLKMKRIFGRREKGKEDLSVDTVVAQKENLVEQLSQQERKFEESRSGMNRSIAVLERQELSLRWALIIFLFFISCKITKLLVVLPKGRSTCRTKKAA